MEKTVIAVDPGTSKCGIALVRRDEENLVELVWRSIAPRDRLIQKLLEAESVWPYALIIVGSGTSSREVVAEIRRELPKIAVLVVDEKDTTMQARERYWLHNPRRGWRRLLPSTLQVPPEPVDDFAALILAERVLNEG
jgi:RNase H-fold protein (predicted Holliday junction resolvase)